MEKAIDMLFGWTKEGLTKDYIAGKLSTNEYTMKMRLVEIGEECYDVNDNDTAEAP